MLAALPIAIGVLTLFGYAIGVEGFWRPIAGGPATNPLTSLCLIALGGAVLLAQPRRMSNVSLALALLAAAIALDRLVAAAAGKMTIIDAITPFPGTMARSALAGLPIQMGLNTAATFVVLALALILRRQRRVVAAQLCAALAAAPPLTSLAGYIYGIPGFFGSMAPPTLVGALAGAASILLYTAHRGILRGILSPWPAGRLARIQIFSLCTACFVLGLATARMGGAGDQKMLAAETICMILLIVVVIGAGAHLYERIDRRRRQVEQSVMRAASLDSLTGLFNRRRFSQEAEAIFATRALNGQPISVFVIDIDWFKSVNDRFGHDAGDEVLRRLGAILPCQVRSTDIIGRMGGEEFAVVLPRATGAKAEEIGETLRAMFEATDMTDIALHLAAVTISVGVASGAIGDITLRKLLSNADTALYQAKRAGRNRVVAYQVRVADFAGGLIGPA